MINPQQAISDWRQDEKHFHFSQLPNGNRHRFNRYVLYQLLLSHFCLIADKTILVLTTAESERVKNGKT
jgi:hypothetical protein